MPVSPAGSSGDAREEPIVLALNLAGPKEGARGELFEAIDGLGFVRARVLGPLVLSEAGGQPNGVRRVEQSAPRRVAPLRATLASHDPPSCWDALKATVALYTDLREQLASPSLVRRTEAERAVKDFLEGSIGREVRTMI